MKIVEWEKTSHRTSKTNMSAFFDHPVPQVTLFKFKTNDFPVDFHKGAFSVKTVVSGSECYGFRNRRVKLSSGQTLLVNQGEEYSSVINQETESLSIFFRHHDLTSAFSILQKDTVQLLDNPIPDTSLICQVPQVSYSNSNLLKKLYGQLLYALDTRDNLAAEEHSRDYLVEALRHALKKTPKFEHRQVIKPSTRDELVSRLMKAKEAVEDLNGQGCTLEFMADVACLSKYHFLRVFRQAYGVSPTAYARKKRLETAYQDLQAGLPRHAVAHKAGYTTYSSFARAYEQVFEMSPKFGLKN